MELCPEFDECDCSTNTNVVTDLEKMELGLEIAGAVLDRLLPTDELKAMKDSMLAFPDHAVKLVDEVNDGATHYQIGCYKLYGTKFYKPTNKDFAESLKDVLQIS